MVTNEQHILFLLDEIEKRNKIIETYSKTVNEYASMIKEYKEHVAELRRIIESNSNTINSLMENSDSQFDTAKSLILKLRTQSEIIHNITKLNFN